MYYIGDKYMKITCKSIPTEIMLYNREDGYSYTVESDIDPEKGELLDKYKRITVYHNSDVINVKYGFNEDVEMIVKDIICEYRLEVSSLATNVLFKDEWRWEKYIDNNGVNFFGA